MFEDRTENGMRDVFSFLHEDERTCGFIDGSNFYSAARALNFDIDYNVLLKCFQRYSRFIRMYYFTAMILNSTEINPLRPLVDWLSYNGYTMVVKPVKEFTDTEGRRRIKGNMDIELAIGMLEMAPHIDHAVLFSGDGDFRQLVEAVQRKGVRVTVISTMQSKAPIISDDLRRQADVFVDVASIKDAICRSNTSNTAQ